MPTLYVENVLADLYAALRAEAARKGKSISAEVLELLAGTVPTPAILARRKTAFKLALKLQSAGPVSKGPFLSTEEMQREDRTR